MLMATQSNWMPFLKRIATVLATVLMLPATALSMGPIQGYVQSPPQLLPVTLDHSRVADQLVLLPLSNNVGRGNLQIDHYLAYRERDGGAIRATVSGQDVGPILNPELPFRNYLYVDPSADECATSRLTVTGQPAWTRVVPAPFFHFGLDQWCDTLVEGPRSIWIGARSMTHRIGLDGQILRTFSETDTRFMGIKAANVDPVTDDLLLVRKPVDQERLVITRLTTQGQVITTDVAGAFDRVLYPVLMPITGGKWRIIAGAPGASTPTIIEWNADFTAQQSVAWNSPLARTGVVPEIKDVRSIDSGNTLILVADKTANGNPSGFRLLSLSSAGAVRLVTEVATQHLIADRLYPVPDAQGLKRHVLVARGFGNGPDHPTLYLLQGTELIQQRELVVAPEHQISALGDSGEFLLAESSGDQLNVTLLSETGDTLERRTMSLVETPDRLYAGLAHDGGHYRVALERDEAADEFRSVLTKHTASGELVWTRTVSGYIWYTIDDAARVCVTPAVGDHLIECFSTADGRPVSHYTTTCDIALHTLHLRSGQLSLGSCIIDPPAGAIDLQQKVVLLAPDRWRAANGDVLWASGSGVRRLSAQGETLNTFGTGPFDVPHTGSRAPLRLLPDGSYVYMHPETVDGRAGLSIVRVDAQGNVEWRHHESGATLVHPNLAISHSPSEKLHVVGNNVLAHIYPPLSDPRDPSQYDRHDTLILAAHNGELVDRRLNDWVDGLVHGNQMIRIGYQTIDLLDSAGNYIMGYHHELPMDQGYLPPPTPIFGWYVPDVLPPTARIRNGRLQFRGFEFPLPQDVPGIRLDQDAVDGAWTTRPAMDGHDVLDGQGIVFDYLDRDRLLFGAWFLYADDADWRESDLRWLTLSGTIPEGARKTTLAIFDTRSGRFDAPPMVTGEQIGSAEIELDSCTTGVVRYRFDAGDYAGLEGTLVISHTAPFAGGCATVNQTPITSPPTSGFGFSTRQSGGYYEPGLDGQGIMIQVRPDIGVDGTIFGTWFTFDPAGASDDARSQHWLTLQGTLADAVDGRVKVQIVRANGGLDLPMPNTSRYDPHEVHESIVGEAIVSFTGCSLVSIDYAFDNSDLAGRFAGLRGTMDLRKPYACQ